MHVSESSSSRRTSNSLLLLIRAVATLAAITSYTTSAQSSSSSCSCSPTKITFQLKFDGTCASTSLTGISDELCFVNVRDDPPLESNDTIKVILSEMKEQRKHSHDIWRRLSHQDDTTTTKEQSQRALNSQEVPTIITKVEIYEYDNSTEMTVINQTEITASDQNLSDGDTFSYTSISTKLDPSIPLEDQLHYYPKGLIVKISGNNTNSDKFVSNTFAWEYIVENCPTEQIAIGDSIGWVDVSVVRPAAGAFCAAAVTTAPSLAPSLAPSSTPTIQPPEPEPPTESPVISPTSSPPTTEPPTESPVISPTSSPTPPTNIYPTSTKAAKVPKSVAAYSYIYNDWSNINAWSDDWSDDSSDDWSYNNGWWSSSSSDSSHYSKPTSFPVYNSPTTTLSNDNIYDWSEVEKDDVSGSASSSSSSSTTSSSLGAKASKW